MPLSCSYFLWVVNNLGDFDNDVDNLLPTKHETNVFAAVGTVLVEAIAV